MILCSVTILIVRLTYIKLLACLQLGNSRVYAGIKDDSYETHFHRHFEHLGWSRSEAGCGENEEGKTGGSDDDFLEMKGGGLICENQHCGYQSLTFPANALGDRKFKAVGACSGLRGTK